MTSLVGQGANFLLRIGSMAIMARLLTPEQFGLVGMVMAVTGFLNLLRDGGLPQATVREKTLSKEMISTLFWLNLAIGCALGAATAMAAPIVAWFYGDPRLTWVTVIIATTFLAYGASAQHRALLQRNMEFRNLVSIDMVALVVGIAIGIGMAMAGSGYWALVGMAVAQPIASMIGLWIVTGWVPGRPRAGTGVRSLLRFGGLLTLNSVVVYVAYNVDKILLGRYWSADVLGLYGRAYQLINIPTENLQGSIGSVMVPALARVQDDPVRLRNYFLKGYWLFLSIVTPITIACALFAKDIVYVLLGPKWGETVLMFQLLAPTILVFAVLNPLFYLMVATGRAARSLKMALVIAPTVILAYSLGLPYGAAGVAFGFSAAMVILLVPMALWAVHGTPITGADLLRTALAPLASTLVGGAAVIALATVLADVPVLLRLSLLTCVLFGIDVLVMLFGFGQKDVYADMVRALRPSRGDGDGVRTGN